ncbi:hypothetical protein UO65_3244 [Actinokineospora spheciospongiae]|uniref:Uncharacterized protein n=1 Tax=Actinokineospora spheciospongiae TaxID=909613 RepID=W7IYD9_9PSEU|nr:hypothetical protein [Actinokineospora spheciospongiae]EWC61506.1 hypothetical protein UO65_3244 [Actinokineospora spheciospongiae]
MAELVRSLDRHLHEHRHKLAGPVSVRINTGVRFPVMIEIRCGNLQQVCAGLLTWRESLDGDWDMVARRTPDGGILSLELTGSTLDGIAYHVVDAVPWHPPLFPGLLAGNQMTLGSVVVHALARGNWAPDRDYPPALACLLDLPDGEESER